MKKSPQIVFLKRYVCQLGVGPKTRKHIPLLFISDKNYDSLANVVQDRKVGKHTPPAVGGLPKLASLGVYWCSPGAFSVGDFGILESPSAVVYIIFDAPAAPQRAADFLKLVCVENLFFREGSKERKTYINILYTYVYIYIYM